MATLNTTINPEFDSIVTYTAKSPTWSSPVPSKSPWAAPATSCEPF
ncbi:hypothetical protein ACWEWX_42705 [Streptomyces asiaticus]